MGRPAKPTKLKLLAENPGRRPINTREPVPTGTPVAPSCLSKEGRAVWTRLVRTAPEGLYTGADEFVIATLCEAVAGWRAATKAIETQGRYMPGSTGQLVISPAVNDQIKQAQLVVQIGSRLGLDPVARTRLMLPDDAQEDDGWGIE